MLRLQIRETERIVDVQGLVNFPGLLESRIHGGEEHKIKKVRTIGLGLEETLEVI